MKIENRKKIFEYFKKGSFITLGIIIMTLVVHFGKTTAPESNPSQNQETPTKNETITLPTPTDQSKHLKLFIEPDNKNKEVLSLINTAVHSIDLVIYEFDDHEIADALLRAQNRGVTVRILLNKAKSFFGKTNPIEENMRQYLLSRGIPVKYAPDYFSYTHQKTVVIDHDAVFIMTFNLVPRFYPTSRDFGVLDTNQNDVSAIEQTFDNDWQGKQFVPTSGDDLLWSPGAETAMLLVIQKATKTLDVYNEEMADQKITDRLIAAEKRGVAVRITMTYQTSYKTAFQQLVAAGIGLRTYPGSSKKRYIHAKAIIADGATPSPYAFLGSQNFSYTSLEKNRELGIFITDPVITSQLEKIFSSDWNGARVFKTK